MGGRMCKKMIKYLKEEPMLRRILTMLISGIFCISILTFFMHYYMLNKIYNQNVNLRNQLIGNLTRLYPQDETEIVKIIINKGSKKDLEYGNQILKKYGYDNSVKAWNDETFNQNVYNLESNDTLICIIVVILAALLFMSCSLYFVKNLQKISTAIDYVMDGNFSFDINTNEEGIISRINTQFYQMSRRMELSINKLNSEKENIKSLITDISHQIKTPLASIKLFNSLLIEDDNLSCDEKSEFLGTIKSEVSKLEWLTQSLIKLSRLEASMIQIKKEKSSINETVLNAIKDMYPKALQKNIEINLEPCDEYFIFHDLKWTKEAISNVIENAIKYTGKNGTIDVSIYNMDSFVDISIKDNGIGIPREDFNNIFKRFFRGNSKTVEEAEGSGIGLYLTRKIIEEQGGSITVDSKQGCWTIFNLFLQKCK